MLELNIQMFAVPARKVSKTRQRTRRAHSAMENPTVTKCPKCGASIKPHRVCRECGYYKGQEVVSKEEDA